MRLISVAIPRPLPGYFSYLCQDEVLPGVRVSVPFRHQTLTGVVIEAAEKAEAVKDAKLKQVIEVLDETPVLNAPVLALLRFAARYYHHPPGEVLQAALPKLLRQGKPIVQDNVRCWSLTAQGTAALTTPLGHKQRALLQHLMTGSADESVLKQEYGVSSGWLENLSRRGWLESRCRWLGIAAEKQSAPVLNPEQKAVLAALPRKDFAVTLLDGVTGSGKTEIYIRQTASLISTGGQVLLLVPEIGLVRILAQRLAGRLGRVVALHHSGLSDKVRLAQWAAVKSGAARVLVGTRSAIFASFQDLRGIIVDEEHDIAFKQQEGLRYHARDLAVVRAKQENIPLLLGSATPALETYHQVWTGKWQRLALNHRAVNDVMPDVYIENIDNAPLIGGLSLALIRAMRRVLAQNGQVMLFLNRRGFAPLLRCPDCHEQSECEDCDAKLTVHTTTQTLQCHHCGRSYPLPNLCSACGGTLQMIGLGTQRLEQTVAAQFPHARVLRIDSDALSSEKQFAAAVAKVHAGEADIILGTQWLSKGHHFPKLQLAAIIDADQALFSADFRGEERLAQLLIQVGGRAGREHHGEVWVQTRQPQHPVFSVLQHHRYLQTAQRLYQRRKEALLPPLNAQIQLSAEHQDMDYALKTLLFTRDGAQNAGIGKDWQWLGPAPAIMAKKHGQYRAHLLIQAQSKQVLQKQLPQLAAWLYAQGKAFRAKVFLDVDPLWLE